MAVENVPEDLSPYYDEGYFTGDTSRDGYMDYDADKEASKQRLVKDLEMLENWLGSDAKKTLFEVGAATGYYLELARERGWEVAGVDISDYAASEARKKGIDVRAGDFDHEPLPDACYSAVAIYDVIEHVKDPRLTVKNMHTVLDDGGLLALTTPNAASLWARFWGASWHAFVPPQHLFYFTPDNLTRLLAEQGFEVIYVGSHGKKFTPPYILRALQSWTKFKLFGSLANAIQKTALANLSIPLNLGDTIHMVARKKKQAV